MATSSYLNNLKAQLDALDKIDLPKLTRSNLGEESLAADLEPRLKRIERLRKLIGQYADYVHDEIVQQMTQSLSSITQSMKDQAARPNPDFIAQRQNFLNNLDSYLETCKRWEPYFITAAVEARGFLEDEGIRQEYQRTVSDLKTEAKATLEEVKRESEKTIGEAKQLAKEIEERARRTAAKVSVQEAQRQFSDAQSELEKKVSLWAKLGVGAVVLFLAFAVLLAVITLPETTAWQALYHTALRVAILSGLGALAAMCFKIFRGYMDMRERNLHRQRVANSMEAFVVSAQTPEVRDFILAHLVEAIVSFGNSGFASKDADLLSSQKLPADIALKLISGATGRKGGD